MSDGSARAVHTQSTVLLHVLIPAYGPSPYLRTTLQAASRLHAVDVRLTVIDDGSPSSEVRNITEEFRVVEYVRLEDNHGVAGAFQRCAGLSCGRYTVISGSDDVLLNGYPQGLRDTLETLAPDMYMPGVEVIDSLGRRSRPLADSIKARLTPRTTGTALSGESLVASLLVGNWLYFPAIAWRTEALRSYGFRTDMTTAMDLDLALRLLFDGGTLVIGRHPGLEYRRHADSVSSTEAQSAQRFAEERDVYRLAARRAAELGWHRAAVLARLRPTSRLHSLIVRVGRSGRRRKPLR